MNDKNVLKFYHGPNYEFTMLEALQMLEYSEKNYTEIAFGVALELICGLRSPEVAKLNKCDVVANKSLNNIVITYYQYKSNQSSKEAPKIIEYKDYTEGRLLALYENHLSYINTHTNDKAMDCGALFIDKNNLPMSTETYRKTLRKLKEEFASTLDNDFADILKNTPLRILMIRNLLDPLRSKEVSELRDH